MAVEVEILADDPRNPGFGYTLRVLIDGAVANRYALGEQTARKIMREAVAEAQRAKAAHAAAVPFIPASERAVTAEEGERIAEERARRVAELVREAVEIADL
jgi:hypothetical protein